MAESRPCRWNRPSLVGDFEMNKFFFAITLNTVLVISAVAQNGNQTKPENTDLLAEAKVAIDKGNAQWVKAWETGKPELIADIFTEDGKMLSQSGKVIKGRGQILERQKAAMQSVGKGVKVTVTTTNVWLDGDTAYETGKYTYSYQENGKPTVDAGKYVTIWKRQKDGSWKLFMDMGVPQD